MRFENASDVAHPHTFVHLPNFTTGIDTWLKLEGHNSAGSIKLKAARAMLDEAESRGLVSPGSELIESTSGNLGIALAMLCAERGYRITLVTDPNANAASVRHMRALGAEVTVVTERDHNGGFLHSRIGHISLRLASEPHLVWLNQYRNRANVTAHRDATAREIVEGFGIPDWLVVGVGTSGTLMGCLEHFERIGAQTHVLGVDAVGSVTFGGTAGPRRIPGLGASRLPELFDAKARFERVLVSEPDTLMQCRHVARRFGLLVGGSTGTALAAVRANQHRIAPGSTVLVLSPDPGGNYLDTVYDDAWVAAHFGPDVLADITTGIPTSPITGAVARLRLQTTSRGAR